VTVKSRGRPGRNRFIRGLITNFPAPVSTQ
jgi:hypothetical protein